MDSALIQATSISFLDERNILIDLSPYSLAHLEFIFYIVPG